MTQTIIKITLLVLLFNTTSICAQFSVLNTNTNSNIVDLVFYNDTLLVVGEINYLAKSHDFGETLFQFETPDFHESITRRLQVIDSLYYLFATRGGAHLDVKIFKSSDYGNSWIPIFYSPGQFFSFFMMNTNFGVMGGSFGSYAMTQNSDTHWELQDSLYSSITTAGAYEDSTMIMLSTGGYSYVSNNNGETWNWGYCHSSNHRNIQFLSKDTIYSVSYLNNGPKAFFSYSYNGGMNFLTTQIGYNNSTNQLEYFAEAHDLFFENLEIGYAIGNTNKGGTIFKTTNSGMTFTPYVMNTTSKILKILNINDSLAFLGGEDGLLVKWDKTIPLTDILQIDELQEIEAQISVYPNPAHESFSIQLPDDELLKSICVKDVLGKIIFETQTNDNSITLTTSTYPSGIYFIIVSESKGQVVKKIMIQH